MSGKMINKKPTYRDLQNEIRQIALFVQKLSSVILQLDQEVVELKNDLQDKGIIDKPIKEEAEEAKKEDYFPAESGTSETDEVTSATQTDEHDERQIKISPVATEKGE